MSPSAPSSLLRSVGILFSLFRKAGACNPGEIPTLRSEESGTLLSLRP
jgi:hypothetical protein